MMEATPELAAVCVIPVWKGGLNRSVNTFGYMFVRKGENPHKIETLINTASQLAKMQGMLNDSTMAQLMELEQTAIQANLALQTLYAQLDEQAKLLAKGTDDGKGA